MNHVAGPMNLGTLIVAPKEHIVAVADLDDATVAEFVPVLRDTARVVAALCRPEQTYVSLCPMARARVSTCTSRSSR